MVSIRSLLDYFLVDELRVIYFILCCVFILLLTWKGKDKFATKVFRYIVLPSVILLVLLLNPFVAHILVTHYEKQSLRFFWMIPVSLLLAIATVHLVSHLRVRKYKLLLAVSIPIILLGFSDNFRSLRSTWKNQITNWYKVPEVVIALDDWIMSDNANLAKSAVFPQPLNLWVRQYRPEIELPFDWGRINMQSEPAKELYRIIEDTEGSIDLCELEYWAKEGGYNYIVLNSDEQYKGKLNAYQEVYRIDTDPLKDTSAYDREYILYRLTEVR